MKKLMIAAAIATMAICSQAVSVKWNLGSQIMNGWDDGTSGQAGDVMIFNANSVTRQAVLTALLEGSSVTAMGTYTTSDGTYSKMKAGTLANPSSGFSPTRDVSGTAYADFFYAMVVTSGDDKYVYLSEAFDTMISTTQNTFLAGDVNAGSKIDFGEETTAQSTGGWYMVAAVPEPTSGLLLLLGMAGLALRRRRA